MKKYTTKVNRLQLQALQTFLYNFISYTGMPNASLQFKMHCAILLEMKQDIDLKLADNYRTSFNLKWTPAKALAFHAMMLTHNETEFYESYEGITFIKISNEINQLFA